MKRFRLTNTHFVIIGLLLLVLVAISISFLTSKVMLFLALFLIMSFVVAIFIYQKTTYELSETEQIGLLNKQTEVSLKNLLDQMPVGVVKFNQSSYTVDWYNPYAELVFTDASGKFDDKIIKNAIKEKENGSIDQSIMIDEKRYFFNVDLDEGVFYFFDNVSSVYHNNVMPSTSPVIGIISIDNYDDITDSLQDAEVSQVNTFIANFITEFAESRHIFYRRFDMDRFYFFTDYNVLSKLIESQFDILRKFKEVAKEKELSLTISMGISYGDQNYYDIGNVAQKNLNMALVRGGDQVVIRENGEHKEFQYFGGGSVSTVKRTRTRTRAMMTAISDKIKTADSVFVVGHRNLDMDALGASIGMQFFASNIIDDAFAVYDDKNMNPDIKRAVTSLQQDSMLPLITLEQAEKLVTKNSILIMVDHSKTNLTLSKELYDKFSEVIVVDHHRRNEDFPENAVLSFIESGASSACELVTELIQFQNARNKQLNKVQASVLMAGIMQDTKNFSNRVTSRTFDVASYLVTLGSDSFEIQTIAATEFEEYRQINELILKGDLFKRDIIISCGDEDKCYSNVIASKSADTMLAMAGIEATFVIFKNLKGQTAISARSRNKLNVQKIMEEMGGGGHFNVAACQKPEYSIKEVYHMLIEKIQKERSRQEEY
ncbi:DHH family phosphoesterase [Streptococcus zalophi]|uniref:Cyclic-di-AMP phosphodiesterase n=1 Tax=Streptococcus zalophi TaxID=640031 RepID=A0A934PAS9_9STRE|nr:DHH family phosphoesterase [Streptococcus zalophi]MBJ8350093.1 DHH family phosphoesterase [Streptococcus zalophi]MCR8968131.1 DHH family phosphoesterase [Streptococcus zalophi]